MEKLKHILIEAKQVGIIYHYTTFEAGLKILQSNQLKSSDAADSTNTKPVFAVSFTRDKRFHDNHVVRFDESSIGNKPQLRFTIDGDKLSNKFKVQPYSQQGAFSKNRKGFEAEERVIANKPFTIPLYDYLMSVDVLLEYKKTSDKYDILSIVNYEMYALLRAKIIKFAQSKNLPINLIINKNGDPWPDKVRETLIQKILNWFNTKKLEERLNLFLEKNTPTNPSNAMIKLKHIIVEAKTGCPIATQDIRVNLKNRQHGIDEYHYGPANPDKPGSYWKDAAKRWKTDEATAKTMMCGNCAAFNVSNKMYDCMIKGIEGNEENVDALATIEKGDLGYCNFLHFKCAGTRSCAAWVTGGSLDDKDLTK